MRGAICRVIEDTRHDVREAARCINEWYSNPSWRPAELLYRGQYVLTAGPSRFLVVG